LVKISLLKSFFYHSIRFVSYNKKGEQMANMKRNKKFWRVFKRKLLKPIFYALLGSVLIYLAISTSIREKRYVNDSVPHFLITSTSNQFNELEFTHMLLTIQELRSLPLISDELVDFCNQPFPSGCPKLLEERLKAMNWAPQAFLVRIKKLFEMYVAYDKIKRIDATMEFLISEVDNESLPRSILMQVDLLKKQKENIINTELSNGGYEFIQQYGGIVPYLQKRVQNIDTK
jgi:hypothetical protein